jgi:hypothetical protein
MTTLATLFGCGGRRDSRLLRTLGLVAAAQTNVVGIPAAPR